METKHQPLIIAGERIKALLMESGEWHRTGENGVKMIKVELCADLSARYKVITDQGTKSYTSKEVAVDVSFPYFERGFGK